MPCTTMSHTLLNCDAGRIIGFTAACGCRRIERSPLLDVKTLADQSCHRLQVTPVSVRLESRAVRTAWQEETGGNHAPARGSDSPHFV